MTRAEWLRSKGFETVGTEWQRGDVAIIHNYPGSWHARCCGVAAFGKTPKAALAALSAILHETAAGARERAAKLEEIATQLEE